MTAGYASIAHRLIDYCHSTAAPFAPTASTGADESQQEQMHDFLVSACNAMSDDPAVFGLPQIPDGHFGWHQLLKSNPQLKKDIQSTAKKIRRLYEFLISLGLLGKPGDDALLVPTKEAKITPKKATLLRGLGLDVVREKDETSLRHPRYPGLPHGWKLLSEIVSEDTKSAVFFFSRGVFSPSLPGIMDVLGAQLGNPETLSAYLDFLQQRDFSSELDISADGMELKVKYFKKLKGARSPLRGFCLQSNALRGNRPACSIDLIESLKFMQRHAEMDADLRGFVFEKSRACNGCGYCIQTNRRLPRKAVRMEHDGQTVLKCPFFLATRWTSLDANTVSLMKKAILFNEHIAAG